MQLQLEVVIASMGNLTILIDLGLILSNYQYVKQVNLIPESLWSALVACLPLWYYGPAER